MNCSCWIMNRLLMSLSKSAIRQTRYLASMPAGSSVIVIVTSTAHPTRVGALSGQHMRPCPVGYPRRPEEGPAKLPQFRLPFDHRNSLPGSSLTRWGHQPSSRSARRFRQHCARTHRGLPRSAHARCRRIGCPLNSRRSVPAAFTVAFLDRVGAHRARTIFVTQDHGQTNRRVLFARRSAHADKRRSRLSHDNDRRQYRRGPGTEPAIRRQLRPVLSLDLLPPPRSAPLYSYAGPGNKEVC
jgi:hypothetical protein